MYGNQVTKVQGVEVTLSQQFATRFKPTDLILPIATVIAEFESMQLAPGGNRATLFRIKDEENGYNLHFYVERPSTFFLWRNGLAVSVAVNDFPAALFLEWTPTSVSLQAMSKLQPNLVGDTHFTPPTGPGRFLREWFRRQALLPSQRYESPEAVVNEIVVQLEHLAEKIRKTAAVDGFWDNPKGVERSPKQEVELTRIVALHLDDFEVTKNIQVYPEANAGAGRMDFLFVATLNDGSSVRVCAEFKRVQSRDLLSGIEKQLPAYMLNKETDYGVFCALDFGPEYPMVAKVDIPGWPDPPSDVALILAAYAAERRPLHVRSVVLPMFKPPSPSSL